MKWKARAFGVVVLLGVALALPTVERRLAADPVMAFSSTQEAFASVKAAGFRCTADNPGGSINNGFWVSRVEINPQVDNLICKGTFFVSQWKGKVWFARRSVTFQMQDAVPDGSRRSGLGQGLRLWRRRFPG
jgi:hypothetical protein